MALEPGGYADKLGNRYEGRWVVREMLRVLNEEICSVTVESIGDDEKGVDLWIEKKDGSRQAQQCKAENAKNDWTMAQLNTRGVLGYLKFQLEQNRSNKFLFVSGTPATMLRDLTRSSRDSTGIPEEFYKYQVQKSKKKQTAFDQFCRYLKIDYKKPEGISQAFDFLKRTYFHPFTDDSQTKDDLKASANYLFTGKPATVVASLAEYAQDHLRKTIYADDIRKYLAELELYPRQLNYDTRIAPAVEKLQRQFEESIQPHLISGELIDRTETDSIVSALHSDDCALVVLHGSVGSGKSGILFELTRKLQKNNFIFLPVRLDRQVPQKTTIQFGHDLGLPESPVRCLHDLAGKRPSVLILDQLDALRWTSTHSADALEVCKELVREIKYLKRNGHPISVVVSCRTFDLQHDPEIKAWLKHDQIKKQLEIKVSALPEANVEKLVKTYTDYSLMPDKQKKLLQSPQNLAMWIVLQQDKEKNIAVFRTSTGLMKQFWESRYRELEKNGADAEKVKSWLKILVDHMEKRSLLWAPERLVKDSPKIKDLFQSFGIIQITSGKITFCHQSYLDFLIADRLLNQIYEEGGTVSQWLGSKERQSLFRREQLRQFLCLLADEDEQEFENNIQELLQNSEVRFHLKHLALSVVGQIEKPWQNLLGLAEKLLETEELREHVLELVYWKHPAYITALADTGILQNWLKNPETSKNNNAVWLLRSINEVCGDFVADMLNPFIKQGEEWVRKIGSPQGVVV